MTKIEWTDYSWNPVTGCTKCSPGCTNCYAEAMIPRLQKMTPEKYRNGFKVTMHPDELEKPLHWKKPRKIFLCSMGDLFHEDVPFEFIKDVMESMWLAPQHHYIILTKRVRRMATFFEKYLTRGRHVWVGVSVCTQEEADVKIPTLLMVGRSDVVRFISVEPMLEPIDLTPFAMRLDWVICGGETGRNARPMNPDWARAIRDQCRATETPFFFKQMSNKQPIPDDLRVREFPTKGGKKQWEFYTIDVSCTDESCWFCIKDTNYVGSFPPRDTFEEAAELWNLRADSALLEAAEEVLKDADNCNSCPFRTQDSIHAHYGKLKSAVEKVKGGGK